MLTRGVGTVRHRGRRRPTPLAVAASPGDSATGPAGDRELGDREPGDLKLGDWELGDWELGDWELGDREPGDWELGDWELGDWELGRRRANQEEVVSTSLVLTVIGPDRPGLIEALSEAVGSHEGSWLESRMARLAGQFAGILRVAVPEEQVDALTRTLQRLGPEGLRVGVARSQPDPPDSDVRELRLEILGSDRPGIVHEISEALADRGINVDELRTEIMSAPMSGELLFRANAELLIPADLSLELLRKDLEGLAHELMVDIDLDESL